MEKLLILSNEKASKNNLNEYHCINLDLKILPDELNKHYEVECIFRKSNKQENNKFELSKIKLGSNIFEFLFLLFKSFYQKNTRYLIVTITPYTFLGFLLMKIFRKKNIFVYLMSSGHEEYRFILGGWSVWIYHFMFKLMTSYSKVIVCHERLYDKNKSFIVAPSRLGNVWLDNTVSPKLDMPRLLYVGRFNPEKGIENFINFFRDFEINCELTIVGEGAKQNYADKNINFLGYVQNEKKLINIYDENNISILPSFTEAHPYVLEESLARKRPIIIFEDIEYVKKNKLGVFICKREKNSILNVINYIMKNYQTIQKEMNTNKLPTKDEMIKKIIEIIN